MMFVTLNKSIPLSRGSADVQRISEVKSFIYLTEDAIVNQLLMKCPPSSLHASPLFVFTEHGHILISMAVPKIM